MWLAALLLSTAPAADPAFLSRSMEAAVSDYERELARVEASGERLSIEPLFALAHVLPDKLLDYDGRDLVLERLSEEGFAELQGRLPGLVVFREETIGAFVDHGFFDSLARAKGTPADTTALGLYRREYEYNGNYPAWIEWRTDFGGCTRFGDGTLVRYYHYWTDYQASYPGRYDFLVSDELRGIENALLAGTCLCDTTASGVVRELELYLREFPKNPVVPDVEQRLKAIRAGQVRFHFNCSPG